MAPGTRRTAQEWEELQVEGNIASKTFQPDFAPRRHVTCGVMSRFEKRRTTMRKHHVRAALVGVALLAVLVLAGAQAGGLPEEEAAKIGVEAYIYGYPL